MSSTAAKQISDFEQTINETALFLGFATDTDLKEKMNDLGGMEPLDWQILRDLITLSGEYLPEAAALLILMLQSRQRGSLCLCTEASVLDENLKRNGASPKAKELLIWLKNAKPPLLSRSPETATPLIHNQENNLLYFQRSFLAETGLKETLSKRLSTPVQYPDKKTTEIIRTALRDVLETKPQTFNNSPVELNPEQKLAMSAGLIQPLTLVTGGPGTGKTSLVAALLRTLLRTGIKAESIRLAAPTGRAAQRLNDAVRESINSIDNPAREDRLLLETASGTIHSLLSYNPKTGTFRHDQHNPLPFQVMIVDEASMVSADLMAALLKALPSSCRLILIGDRDQLPSVDAGAVLSDLLPDTPSFSEEFSAYAKSTMELKITPSPGGRFRDRTVFLRHSYRSVQGILDFADAVNSGAVSAAADLPKFSVPEDPSAGIAFPEGESCLRCTPPEKKPKLYRFLLNWLRSGIFTGKDKNSWTELLKSTSSIPVDGFGTAKQIRTLFTLLSDARILTTLRRGPRGCESINNFLCTNLKEAFDPGYNGSIFHGLPIMITQNDASRGLFNGDVGLILKSGNKFGKHTYRAVFDRPEKLPVFPIDELPAWEPAFAITVHKSQGSEYGEVLLVMPDQPGHCLNTREILYTGITRGKKRAIVMGEKEVIEAAIVTPDKRESGLKIWSREAQ